MRESLTRNRQKESMKKHTRRLTWYCKQKTSHHDKPAKVPGLKCQSYHKRAQQSKASANNYVYTNLRNYEQSQEGKNSKTLKLAIRDATNIFDKAFNAALQIIDKNTDTKNVNEKGMPYRHIHYHTVLGNKKTYQHISIGSDTSAHSISQIGNAWKRHHTRRSISKVNGTTSSNAKHKILNDGICRTTRWTTLGRFEEWCTNPNHTRWRNNCEANSCPNTPTQNLTQWWTDRRSKVPYLKNGRILNRSSR